ncbi:MAG: hypothetical protein ACRDL7_00340 [Gaiellaceae bacterium]
MASAPDFKWAETCGPQIRREALEVLGDAKDAFDRRKNPLRMSAYPHGTDDLLWPGYHEAQAAARMETVRTLIEVGALTSAHNIPNSVQSYLPGPIEFEADETVVDEFLRVLRDPGRPGATGAPPRASLPPNQQAALPPEIPTHVEPAASSPQARAKGPMTTEWVWHEDEMTILAAQDVLNDAHERLLASPGEIEIPVKPQRIVPRLFPHDSEATRNAYMKRRWDAIRLLYNSHVIGGLCLKQTKNESGRRYSSDPGWDDTVTMTATARDVEHIRDLVAKRLAEDSKARIAEVKAALPATTKKSTWDIVRETAAQEGTKWVVVAALGGLSLLIRPWRGWLLDQLMHAVSFFRK